MLRALPRCLRRARLGTRATLLVARRGARMRFLRTTSTARLVALVLGAAVVAAGTAAIALAATGGGGQKPPPAPLAKAVRDALTAPKVDGVTARIKFTNHLIDSSAVTGS